MLELIISIAIFVVLAFNVMIAIRNLNESNERIAKIAEGQQQVSKDLLAYIDKNINERVVYANPEVGYTNVDKFEKEEEEEKEPEDIMEIDESILEEMHKPKQEEGDK